MRQKIVIDIETNFKPFIMKDDFGDKEDFKKDVEDTFHNKLFELIEEFILDEDKDNEQAVLETINDEYLNNNEQNIEEYDELGGIYMSISQDIEKEDKEENGIWC